MTVPYDNWKPSPELLAAYFDGECEGRDDLSALKQRIEDWIAAHPEAQEALAAHRRLLQIWHETTPPEPPPEKWGPILARLEASVPARGESAAAARPRRRRAAIISVAAAAVAGMAVFLGWQAIRPAGEAEVQGLVKSIEESTALAVALKAAKVPDAEEEILPVALASEVTIVRVEGADMHTLVVGELPFSGLMELVAPGEVVLTQTGSDWRDSDINPVRLVGGSSPMIWARLESETDD